MSSAGAAVAAISLSAFPGAALASTSDAEIAGLRRASCPASYEVTDPGRRSPTAELRAAREFDMFKVSATYVTLTPPIDWLQNPEHSQRFRIELADLRWIGALLQAYREEGDREALRQARNLVIDWAWRQPPGGSETSGRAWTPKPVGDRAPYIAYVVRAASCEGMLPRDHATLLLDSLETHAQFVLRTGRWRNEEARAGDSTNRGLYARLGLLLIAKQLPFMSQAEEWRRRAVRGFKRILRNRIVDGEGFWLEHSSSYHLAVTRLLGRFLELIDRDERNSLPRLRDRMRTVRAWLTQPDGRVVQLGDSHLRPGPADDAAQLRGLFALPRSGLAFVRERDSYLATYASFHNTDHKHSDELSIDLFEDGHRIVSDTGQYHSDRGRLYTFAHSARAHSTLTADGQGLPRAGSHAYGSGILRTGSTSSLEGGTWYAIEGTNPLLGEHGIDHHRLLLYLPGVVLIVVDRVRADDPHRYQRYFQLGPELSLTGDGPLRLSAPGFDGTLSSTSSAPAETLTTVRGAVSPRLGWISPAFRVLVPRWTVAYETEGEDVDHVATFDLTASGLRTELIGKVGAITRLRLGQGGAPDVILEVTRDPGRLILEERVAG